MIYNTKQYVDLKYSEVVTQRSQENLFTMQITMPMEFRRNDHY